VGAAINGAEGSSEPGCVGDAPEANVAGDAKADRMRILEKDILRNGGSLARPNFQPS
jgi:hypothetical protein